MDHDSVRRTHERKLQNAQKCSTSVHMTVNKRLFHRRNAGLTVKTPEFGAHECSKILHESPTNGPASIENHGAETVMCHKCAPPTPRLHSAPERDTYVNVLHRARKRARMHTQVNCVKSNMRS